MITNSQNPKFIILHKIFKNQAYALQFFKIHITYYSLNPAINISF